MNQEIRLRQILDLAQAAEDVRLVGRVNQADVITVFDPFALVDFPQGNQRKSRTIFPHDVLHFFLGGRIRRQHKAEQRLMLPP